MSVQPLQRKICVLTALSAHHSAATIPEKPRLHCDVSGGNVLIYPRIFKDTNGISYLKWTGLLADWEMSKPILPDGKRGPRQPERMVCALIIARVMLC